MLVRYSVYSKLRDGAVNVVISVFRLYSTGKIWLISWAKSSFECGQGKIVNTLRVSIILQT